MIHQTVLIAVGALPLGIFVLLAVANEAAARNRPEAIRFVHNCCAADAHVKVGAVLLAMSGAVHLGLVPPHVRAQPITAALFIVNGAGSLVLAIAVLNSVTARVSALLWLMATAMAYCAYILTGLELLDGVGIATLAVEFAAIISLGLLSPRIHASPATPELQGELA